MAKVSASGDDYIVAYIDDLLGDSISEATSSNAEQGSSSQLNSAAPTSPATYASEQSAFIDKHIHTAALASENPESSRTQRSLYGDQKETIKQANVAESVAKEHSRVEKKLSPKWRTEAVASAQQSTASTEHQTETSATQQPEVQLQSQADSNAFLDDKSALLAVEELERKQRVERLLRESALRNSIKSPPLEKTPVDPVLAKPKLTSSTSLTKPAASKPAQTKTPAAPVETTQATTSDEENAAAADKDDDGGWLNGKPQWAQERFDVLLFSVSGLTLAVPLISLGQIQKLNDELTPIFGQANWFMGLLPSAHGKIRCVDTALFVMPERYKPEFRDGYRFIVTINGHPWGLAVDEVKQPIQLEPASVNWRGVRSQRPWLAGTIKDHMCALIDIPMLGKILAQQDKNSAQRG